MDTKAAAERVYDAAFGDMKYVSADALYAPQCDMLNKVFRHVMVQRIERAINGEPVESFDEEAKASE